MRLFIALDKEKGAFRPGDDVRGVVEIRDRVFKTLPTVTVAFRGQVRVVSRRQNLPSEYALHTLFKESHDVTATEAALRECEKLDQPVYSAPFKFKFPTLCAGCPCQLPPSFHKSAATAAITVEYVVVVALRYKVLGRLARTDRVQRELSFRSETPVMCFAAPTVGCLPADRICPKMNASLREAAKIFSISQPILPPYTPSVQLQVGISSPPVSAGGAIPVLLKLQLPPQLLQEESIFLRSTVMHLKTSVAAVVGKVAGVVSARSHCWSSSGRVKIDKQCFELDPGTWSSCIVDGAPPTCSTCVLNLKHFVEVKVGISRGDSEDIQYVEASLEVFVVDPPPTYSPIVSREGNDALQARDD